MSESPFPSGETEPGETPGGRVGEAVRAAQAAVAEARGLPSDTIVEFATLTPEEYEVAQTAAAAVFSGESQ